MWVCGSWTKETLYMWVCGSWAKDALVRWWRARNKERGRLKERKVQREREEEEEEGCVNSVTPHEALHCSQMDVIFILGFSYII